MDNGWAVIAGSAIGIIGTLGATSLNAYLNRKKPDPAEVLAKKLLKDMLEAEKYKWRTIRTLSNVIGLNEESTRKLLLEIGARGSERNPELWGLISRNSLPHHVGIPDPTLPV